MIEYIIFEQRLIDTTNQNLLHDIKNTTKGVLYQHLIDNVCLQTYLKKPIDTCYRKYISKFRISAHSLNIETGRHQGIDRIQRKCTKCQQQEIEDEFHFILKCPFYNDLGKKFLKNYYTRH